MKPSQTLKRHWAEIRRIIASHRAGNARVFGSVLHGKDNEGSDLYELGELLGVEVDVLTPNALSGSFREKVLNEAVPV